MAPGILGAFRIIAGIMFACYGAQKVFDAFGGLPPGVPKTPIVWTAGLMELIGGVLIAIGLFTRITAFLCSGEMAIAYFVGHATNGFWPIVNHGELAILFCWIFLYIAAQGPGAFALDDLRRGVRLAPAVPGG
jgi:putative oxidoreductase